MKKLKYWNINIVYFCFCVCACVRICHRLGPQVALTCEKWEIHWINLNQWGKSYPYTHYEYLWELKSIWNRKDIWGILAASILSFITPDGSYKALLIFLISFFRLFLTQCSVSMNTTILYLDSILQLRSTFYSLSQLICIVQ